MKNHPLLRLFSIGLLSLLSIYSFSQSITEFHYDNVGGDVNEFVEVTLPAGANPACYTIYLVNGEDNDEYEALSLPATPTSAGCAGGTTDIYHVFEPGIQQGPEGIALVNTCTTMVEEYISYEGTLTSSTFGGFTGQTSVDIGIAETGTTPTTASLAFDGTMWLVSDPSTPGLPNDGSACGGAATCSITAISITSAACNGNDFDYEICATVANGSGDYNLIEVAAMNTTIASMTGVADGQFCYNVTIAGQTVVSTIDLNIVDAADAACIGAMPVTLNILECPTSMTTPDVYISELSYNPCGAQGADTACEYIIITNAGSTVADISDYTISSAFTYTFPAGTTIPAGGSISLGISANCTGLTAFDLSGGWGGGLGNDGETVELNDPSGANVFTVPYSDNIADGDCNAVCIDNMGVISECESSLEPTGGTCPDLSSAPPIAVIIDSTCPAGDNAPMGGSIAAPTTDCPPNSFLEYSEDGISWSTTPPMYNQAGPLQLIQTRCVCDDDPTMISDTPLVISTMPATCAGCGASISSFPANPATGN